MFITSVPIYAYVVVVVSAIGVGLAVSFLIWYLLCRRKAKVALDAFSDSPVQSPKTNKFKMDYSHPPPTTPVVEQFIQPPKSIPTSVIPVQPVTKSPLVSSSEGDDARTKRLDERLELGKVAKLTITANYSNGELLLNVYQVKEIHSSISIHHAHVELKYHYDERLRTVRLIHKGSKLMGTGQDYRYQMPQNELCKAAFNLYLWSADSHSRNYQAGVCKILFEGKTEADFIEGFTVVSDFELSNEDTTGCARLSLMLRYNNRSGRLIVFIHSIAEIPNLGWRRHFNGLVPILGEPSPMVKVELHREGKPKEKDKTNRVQGFNPVFNKTFCYDVPLTELNTVKLVLKIVYSDRVTQDMLGVLEFGANSTGTEGEHWREMEQAVHRECGVTKDHFIKQLAYVP